jgi:hypothetical protein
MTAMRSKLAGMPPAIAAQATILNPLPGIYQRHQRAIVVTLCLLAAMLGLSLAAGLLLVLRKNRQIGANAGAASAVGADGRVQDSWCAQQIAAVAAGTCASATTTCSARTRSIASSASSAAAARPSARTFWRVCTHNGRPACRGRIVAPHTRESGQACDITYRIVLPDGMRALRARERRAGM